MRLILQGLNSGLNSAGTFELIQRVENNFDLNDLYSTFDSIYYLNKQVDNLSTILIYDQISKSFKFLFDEKNFEQNKVLSVCSNSNYFFCLIFNNLNSKIELLQFSNKTLINKLEIENIKKENIYDLILISTDVNTYIFQNDSNGLKCVYELKTRKDLEKRIKEQEARLNENSISSLPLNKILINQKIKQFSIGKEHVLMLTEKSKSIYSFGIGIKGQLGHGKIENSFEPKLISAEFNLDIASIPTGNVGWHSGAIDKGGNCYLWGWNSNGQLGDLDSNSAFISCPTKLIIKDSLTYKDTKFRSISLGARHTALIDFDNNLYNFGWNKYQQVFKENEEHVDDEKTFNIENPIKVFDYENKVIEAKCGCWSTFILVKD